MNVKITYQLLQRIMYKNTVKFRFYVKFITQADSFILHCLTYVDRTIVNRRWSISMTLKYKTIVKLDIRDILFLRIHTTQLQFLLARYLISDKTPVRVTFVSDLDLVGRSPGERQVNGRWLSRCYAASRRRTDCDGGVP